MTEKQIKMLLSEYNYDKNELQTTLQFLLIMAKEIVQLQTGERL